MLILDFLVIGNKLFKYRKKRGLTQAEVAEKAGISDRTYADIERGSVNMRVETLLKICDVLSITPDDVLTEECEFSPDEIQRKFSSLSPSDKKVALQLMEVFIKSLN